MESHVATEQGIWSVPQCAFTIEYSQRVLEDIRLAVVDAFFSLPRGGAEIGGLLLGRHEGHRVVISGFVDLGCEHAHGPSFTLSPNDHSRLAELMAQARGNPGGDGPVGWYHSHTRTDIFLSAEDLEIHKRYFPEPWQIALVLKPHTFQPTRAGFFFRGSDGMIRSSASYQEFAVEPLATKAAPEAEPAAARPPFVPEVQEEPIPELPEELAEEPLPAAAEDVPEPRESEPIEHAVPLSLLAAPPTRSWHLGIVLPLAVLVVAAVVAGFETRSTWGPRLGIGGAPVVAAAPARDLSFELRAIDREGQLVISWDRRSAAIQQSELANLIIDEGGDSKVIELDTTALKTGTFTYGRKGERVEVSLTLHLLDGHRLRESTTYLGQPPAPKPVVEDEAVRRQRDALDKELKATQSRNKHLEKSVEEMRRELLREQRRRLGNQSPDSAK